MDSNGCADYLLFLFLLFCNHITCHIPSFFKDFPISILPSFFVFCVWLLNALELGFENSFFPALARLLAACNRCCAKSLSCLVLSYLVNQAVVFFFPSIFSSLFVFLTSQFFVLHTLIHSFIPQYC
ncbi:hypothetical protein ACQKWADRAFT_239132 [Trichoderma austrokoningii]